MGVDLITVLAVMGTVGVGNPLSLNPGFSIGGKSRKANNVLGNLFGLLGTPQGLDHAHNWIESDSSNTRDDLYVTGDASTMNMTLFLEAYNSSEDTVLTMDDIGARAAKRFEESIAMNPNFYYGPYTGMIARNSGYAFTGRILSNHTTEHPFGGHLTKDVFSSFYAVYEEDGKLVYRKGHEQIPANWYRIGMDYGLVQLNLDLVEWFMKYPILASIGGNLGKVDNFSGLDLEDITGGVLNATSLLEGNNLATLVPHSTSLAVPVVVTGLDGAATTVLSVGAGLIPTSHLTNHAASTSVSLGLGLTSLPTPVAITGANGAQTTCADLICLNIAASGLLSASIDLVPTSVLSGLTRVTPAPSVSLSAGVSQANSAVQTCSDLVCLSAVVSNLASVNVGVLPGATSTPTAVVQVPSGAVGSVLSSLVVSNTGLPSNAVSIISSILAAPTQATILPEVSSVLSSLVGNSVLPSAASSAVSELLGGVTNVPSLTLSLIPSTTLVAIPIATGAPVSAVSSLLGEGNLPVSASLALSSLLANPTQVSLLPGISSVISSVAADNTGLASSLAGVVSSAVAQVSEISLVPTATGVLPGVSSAISVIGNQATGAVTSAASVLSSVLVGATALPTAEISSILAGGNLPESASNALTSLLANPTQSNALPAVSSVISAIDSQAGVATSAASVLSSVLQSATALPSAEISSLLAEGNLPTTASAALSSLLAQPSQTNVLPAISSIVLAIGNQAGGLVPSAVTALSSVLAGATVVPTAAISSLLAVGDLPQSASIALSSLIAQPTQSNILPAVSSVLSDIGDDVSGAATSAVSALSSLIEPVQTGAPADVVSAVSSLIDQGALPTSANTVLSSLIAQPTPISFLPVVSSVLSEVNSQAGAVPTAIAALSSLIDNPTQTEIPQDAVSAISSLLADPSLSASLGATVDLPEPTGDMLGGLTSIFPQPATQAIGGLTSLLPEPTQVTGGLTSLLPEPTTAILGGLTSLLALPTNVIGDLTSALPAPTGTLDPVSAISSLLGEASNLPSDVQATPLPALSSLLSEASNVATNVVDPVATSAISSILQEATGIPGLVSLVPN
ncbi:Cloroperoxidase, partial [Aureobasidium pullulans]